MAKSGSPHAGLTLTAGIPVASKNGQTEGQACAHYGRHNRHWPRNVARFLMEGARVAVTGEPRHARHGTQGIGQRRVDYRIRRQQRRGAKFACRNGQAGVRPTRYPFRQRLTGRTPTGGRMGRSRLHGWQRTPDRWRNGESLNRMTSLHITGSRVPLLIQKVVPRPRPRQGEVFSDNSHRARTPGLEEAFLLVEPRHEQLVEFGKRIDVGHLRTVLAAVVPFSGLPRLTPVQSGGPGKEKQL
jgi:hypothetical protein